MSSTHPFRIAVMGGSGGCGASVLACALATRAAIAGHRTLVVDLDPFGGGLAVHLGLERHPGPRWRDLHGLRGEVDGPALLDQLPETADGLATLSFDHEWFQADSQLTQPVVDALGAVVDVLVLDCPRAGAVPSRVDACVLLTNGSMAGIAGAHVTADRLIAASLDPWLVTSDTDAAAARLMSEALLLPLLAEFHREASVAADLTHGVPPARSGRSGLARAADVVLRDLMIERRAAS